MNYMDEMVQAEAHALRQEIRRLETMNEALIDAGKTVVKERDELRIATDTLARRCADLERSLRRVQAGTEGPEDA